MVYICNVLGEINSISYRRQVVHGGKPYHVEAATVVPLRVRRNELL